MTSLRNNLWSHTPERLLLFIAVLIMPVLQPFFASAGSGVVCDIQQGPCVMETNGMTIAFDIRPKPVKSMSELQFMVTVKRNNAPVTNAAVALDLSMPGMYMGKNRPVLKHLGKGAYQGAGIITRCTSGQRTWQAKITVGRRDPATIALFQFEVH
jgi:hypothetical protein